MANNFVKFTLKQPKNMSSVIANGSEIIKRYADEQTYKTMVMFARLSVLEAIAYYDDSSNPKDNLTGNTKYGFVAAVYKNGSLVNNSFEIGYKVAGAEKPYHYTFVGDRGFYDRGSGELIKYGVRDYRDNDKYFVEHDNYMSSAYADAMSFLRSYNPKYKNGYSVAVASISPYVELIREWKHLDILESSCADHKSILREALKFVYH